MLGAAAVAAALWLVSGLVHVAFASNVYVDRLLRLGIPTPTMAQFWSWPFPWSILTLLLAVISVAAVFLVVLNLVTRKPRTGPAFASAWFAVIVAGVVTGLAIDAIVLMSSVQAVGSRALATASIEYAIIGAYWGFVQGWIPALIASREVKEDDAQAPPPRMRTAWFVRIAVVALAALVVTGMLGADAQRRAAARVESSAAAGSIR